LHAIEIVLGELPEKMNNEYQRMISSKGTISAHLSVAVVYGHFPQQSSKPQ